jgi:hypothetical protein
MSRGNALARTLQIPAHSTLQVRAVKPSGDCFYEAMDILLAEPPPRRAAGLASPQAMRDLVAERMTQELFELYSMYATAGVEDFAWMQHHRAPRDLEALREYATRSGKAEGAGQCLWADEHALQTIASEAKVTLLIIDEQATSSRGSRSGRRRGGSNDDGPDGRFLAIGQHSACVILHRSRRQHYNAVIVDDMPTIPFDALPESTRALWPSQIAAATAAASVPAGAAAAAAEGAAASVDLTGDDDGDGEAAAAATSSAAAAAPPPSKKPRLSG